MYPEFAEEQTKFNEDRKPQKMNTGNYICWSKDLIHCMTHINNERGPAGGRGPFHVAHLNFKTSRVGVYKCLLLIVRFAVTVTIWPREVVSCRDFILRAVALF